MTPILHSWIEAATGRVVNATLEGLVIAGLVWLFLRIFGRHNSRTRFAIWFLALLLIAVLPFIANFHGSQPASHVVTLPADWAIYLATAWALGVTLSLAQLGVGIFHLFCLRRSSQEIDPAMLPPSIARRLSEYGGTRSVRLCHSSGVSVPAVIGFARPAIILPTSLVPQLSEEEMDVVLLHELAHLRRWDDWSNLAQRMVKAVFFFHPAVWWIENRLTIEREMACDDIVIAQTANPRAYAAFLISFHEKLQRTGTLALMQALVSRVCQLSLRVVAILNSPKSNTSARRMPMLGVAMALVGMVFSIVPRVPEMVSFGSRPQAQIASTTHPVEGLLKVRPAMDEVTSGKLIPAAYHPPATLPIKRAVAKKPRAIRPTANSLSTPRMLIVVRTTQFDGAAWTICVWSLNPATNSTTQSTWVLKI